MKIVPIGTFFVFAYYPNLECESSASCSDYCLVTPILTLKSLVEVVHLGSGQQSVYLYEGST